MIVIDEFAPPDHERPCVSMNVYANGKETAVRGDVAIVAVVDEGCVDCFIAGEGNAQNLAALGLAAEKTAERTANAIGAGAEYHIERLRLILGDMEWKGAAHAAD